MLLLVSALIVAAAALVGAWRIARALEGESAPAGDRLLPILQTFAPAVASVGQDPKALLAWAPLVRTARRLFAEEFAALDRAAGAPFPFGPDQIQNAHARWTTDWLAWELAHDTEYKLKTAALEELRGQMRDAQAEVKQSLAHAGTLKGELDQIRATASALTQDYAKIRETSREAREDTAAAMTTVKEVEKKLGY